MKLLELLKLLEKKDKTAPFLFKVAANCIRSQAEHINNLDVLLDKKYAIIKQQSDRIKELETKYEQEFKYGENLLKEKNDYIYN